MTMRIDRTPPAGSATDGHPSARPEQQHRSQRDSHGEGEAGSSPHEGRAPFADTVAIAGIPEEELTASVREAIRLLIDQVEHLREDFARAQARIAFLEHQAAEHPLLPLVNRRAFLRDLSRLLAHAERDGTPPGVLLFFHIGNLEDVRLHYGIQAGDALLMRVGAVLLEHVQEPDVAASLDGPDFGVILVCRNEAEARERLEAIVRDLDTCSATWDGHVFWPRIIHGLHVLEAGERPERALDAFDTILGIRSNEPG